MYERSSEEEGWIPAPFRPIPLKVDALVESDLNSHSPGSIASIRGLVFQADAKSAVVTFVIRPFQVLDRWVAGIRELEMGKMHPNHVGIHVVLEDGREIVVEQLPETRERGIRDGLNWNTIDRFRARDQGGWDATVPLAAFRGISDAIVQETITRLNTIDGRSFAEEKCTQFIERAFGNRRLFADSPVLAMVGIPARLGDPALPLLRPDAQLDAATAQLLQIDALRGLPDAIAGPGSTTVRDWEHWLTKPVISTLGLVIVAGFAFRFHRGVFESVPRVLGRVLASMQFPR